MNNIVGMFRKSRNVLESGGITPTVEEKIRCPICKAIDTKRSVAKNKMVCPSCGYHYPVSYTHLDVYKRQALKMGSVWLAREG